MIPSGGTEIQHRFLSHYVDDKLLNNFQICTSIPGKVELSKSKINILWQKNSHDQPNIYPWFEDKSNHDKFDWYVFNSHWNYEKYRYRFDIPTHKCHVIKNGVNNFPTLTPFKQGDMVRMLFHVTPWRGLNVLLGAMSLLKDCNVHVDIFSSCKIYGEEFEKENESKYEPLYEQARKLENVNYIGYKEHSFIQKFIYRYHMFAYPSTWEETSCNAALRSLWLLDYFVLLQTLVLCMKLAPSFLYTLPMRKIPKDLLVNLHAAITTSSKHDTRARGTRTFKNATKLCKKIL